MARNASADLLKGLAGLLMVQVHVMELLARPELLASPLGAVSLFLGGPPCAPVFMAVMGYYLARGERLQEELVARAGHLLGLAVLLNLGLNAHLLLRIHVEQLALDPWRYVFGVDILVLAALSTAVFALLRPMLGRSPRSWALAALGTACAAPAVHALPPLQGDGRWLAAALGGPYDWSYFPLFPWLAYPLLGAAVAHGLRTRPVACAGIVVLGAPWAVQVARDLPAYYHHGPLFFLWTAAFLGLWTSGWVRGPACLAWIGKRITAFYVAQWLLVGNLATALYRTQGPWECAAWFVVLTLGAAALAWGWDSWSGRAPSAPAGGPGSLVAAPLADEYDPYSSWRRAHAHRGQDE